MGKYQIFSDALRKDIFLKKEKDMPPKVSPAPEVKTEQVEVSESRPDESVRVYSRQQLSFPKPHWSAHTQAAIGIAFAVFLCDWLKSPTVTTYMQHHSWLADIVAAGFAAWNAAKAYGA